MLQNKKKRNSTYKPKGKTENEGAANPASYSFEADVLVVVAGCAEINDE